MLLLVLLLACAPGGGASFERGLQASFEGDAAGAAQAFAQALDEGAVHAATYHGLGNALFRQERLGLATAAWMRGLALEPQNADLRANLEHARGLTRDRLELPVVDPGPFFWLGWISPARQALGVAAAWTLGLLAWLVAAREARQQQAPLPRPSLPSAALLGLGLLLAVGLAFDLRRPTPATVLVAEVPVRSAMGADGVELFRLHEGAVVLATERWEGREGGAGAAVLIELGDGRKGWVPAGAVDLARADPPFPRP